VSAPDDLGYLLQQAAKQYRTRFAIELRPQNLTTQQAAVLMALAATPDRALAPSAVAEVIGADPATTTGLLQRLERDGWLSSVSNPGDGRSRLVSLTPTAEQTVPSLMEIAEGVSARAGDALSARELDTLVSLLARLVEHEAAAIRELKS
jgi:DNA-binding MarR family transcriptional regulator